MRLWAGAGVGGWGVKRTTLSLMEAAGAFTYAALAAALGAPVWTAVTMPSWTASYSVKPSTTQPPMIKQQCP
jgi:hypothetical protein